MSAITAEHVTKRFGGFEAVSDVSFEVPGGQFLAVLGPNGAGKTTTLEMLEGFSAPTSGTVRVLGAAPHRGSRAWRARIGLVLQSTSLDPAMTVRGTLAMFAGLYPDPRPAGEAIEVAGLKDDAATKVGVLSGGQRRRGDLAIAVIGRPEVLFLDEPTTALDPEARRHTWAAIENLAATGTTIVLTTHYTDEADHLAERILVLAAGQIVADTTPARLRAQAGPATIRYVLEDPGAASALPARFAPHLEPDGRTLLIRTTDTPGMLRELAGFADGRRLALAGLEVGQPSLEEAYLALIDSYPGPEAPRHD